MKFKVPKKAEFPLTFLTEGLDGAVLIRRRMAEVCIACGITPVHALNPASDLPWLCETCLKRPRPKPARFNHKAERAAGIANLDRLLGGPDE